MASRRSGRTCGLRTACTSPTTTSAGFTRPLSHRLCDRWSSGGPAEETAEWMAVTRARSASQPGAGADSSTPNPGKPFGTRSPLYRCWPHRLSTSGGNDAGVLRKLGSQKPKAATGRNSFPPLVLRCSSGLSQRRKDKAMVVSFDTNPELVSDLIGDPEKLSTAIRSLRPGGGTAFEKSPSIHGLVISLGNAPQPQ